MASVSKGMFGGALPWGMIWTGVAIGAAIIVLDEILKARGARFRAPVLAASFGIYLPLELTVPIFLGGLIAYLVERKAVTSAATPTRSSACTVAACCSRRA